MAAKRKRRGKLIVLEGVDGAGTTTQQRRLIDWLTGRGELAHGTAEPTDGPIGNLIRQILRGRLVARPPGAKGAVDVDPAAVALLFAADRLDHLANEIVPRLDQGWHVVCDRYVLSSLAYQSLDTDLPYVRQINARALDPNLTLYLRVRPEIGMARIEASRLDRESFERLGLQKRVAAAYDALLEDYRAGRVAIIDGEQDVSAVTQQVRGEVEALLG